MTNHSAGILRLALPVNLRRSFDYLPPKHLGAGKLTPGVRVRVPFGPRVIIGILVSLHTSTDVPLDKLRHAHAILDDHPILGDTMLKLVQWMARYYHHPLGDTITQTLPVLLRQGNDLSSEVHSYWVPEQQLDNQSEQQLMQSRAFRQQEAWQVIKRHSDGVSVEAMRSMGFEPGVLKNLQQKGLITQEQRAVTFIMFHDHSPLLKSAPLVLNSEQSDALAAITGNPQFHVTLLHGVTGSGKTEVYLQAIAQVLSQGRQALVMIPEIGLTPQTMARFQERFNVPVVILHSGLSDKERLKGWLSARCGEAGIVITTRSGIFTPLYAPGIIIIDEEHDLSYKQQDSIRYSARDVALYRAQLENIPVVLGTATPSLETLHNSIGHDGQPPRYRYQHLSARAGGAVPPKLQLIDTRQQSLHGGLTPESLTAMRQTLNDGQQVLVFLNRRGYAPTIICDECGWLLECPNCDAHLTLHRTPLYLHCHHCDYRQGIPDSCPNCHTPALSPVGQGTERTEEVLEELFAKGRQRVDVLRIDRDSMGRKKAFQEMMHKVHKGEPVILVGTQMLAKGHHFPGVTLVVIINADTGFFSADFRGAEKTGQLILQVAGRSGRAHIPGRVLIQTSNPDHPQLQQLIQQGYDAFAKTILQERKHIGLPPYSYQALITAEANDAQYAQAFLEQTANIAQELMTVNQFDGPTGVRLLGPMPAPMEKRQGRMRWQLLLDAKERKPLHNLLSCLLPYIEQDPSARRVRWSVDIDPQELV